MKKMILGLMASACLILLLSAGCNNVKELDYKGIQSTEIQTLNFSNVALKINLEYYNPNNFGVDVKESNLTIFLNDKFVAVADQPNTTQVPKLSNFIFPVVAHFDPLKIVGTAFAALSNKTNKLTIQGTAKLGKGGVYIKVPINITENVNLNSN